MPIEIDFLSVVIGYVCGFIFSWQVCTLILEQTNEQ